MFSLVHVSFSSCLPHVFPPHLAQTLHQELLQYLLKDPEPIGVLASPLSPTLASPGKLSPLHSASELSLPVPQIRLPTGAKVVDVPESSKTFRPDSSLVLLSSHRNGSLNAWSVELTVQSNYCTSISGLIHCGQTGGHSKDVQCMYRHPWLPIIMTVANNGADCLAENELIVWNANKGGPLNHKAQINELSRISSPEINSFTVVCWVPPIGFSESNVNALSRCPSFGIFVANVGNELCLFQSLLYPVIPPNNRHTLYHSSCCLHSSSSQIITMTSHSGTDGVAVIGLIDDDIEKFEDIVSVHAFRMDSTFIVGDDCAESCDLSNEVLITLIENRHGTYNVQSYIHAWRVILQETEHTHSAKMTDSLDPWYQLQSMPLVLCHSAITKVISGERFPMHDTNAYILQSKPACDIASSLQLQLPSLSSPYLFTTVSSHGSINCWQFRTKVLNLQANTYSGSLSKLSLHLQLYDVFGTSGSLNCFSNDKFSNISVSETLPVALSCAYPGRFAIAHTLNHPLEEDELVGNPLAKHMMLSIWECESSGGVQWVCESLLSLCGIGDVATSAETFVESVHMDWLPMENGSYLLAVCFSSVISIFGIALPSIDSQLSVGYYTNSLSEKSTSKWSCLLNFSLNHPYNGSSVHWLVYTGSNSFMIGMGCGIEIYTCWLEGEKLFTKASGKLKSNHELIASNQNGINLLDYAHSKNSPLPQYHPRTLTDLLSSGKLEAVKLILVNLTKHLLLYQKSSSFDEIQMEDNVDCQSHLITIVDGCLKRKDNYNNIVEVENIPPLSLSQLKLFGSDQEGALDEESASTQDDYDYDALFSYDRAPVTYDLNSKSEPEIDFDKVKLSASQFTPVLANKLASILQYCQLPGISIVEHVQVIAIAHTVAKTKISFSETPAYSNISMQAVGVGYTDVESRTEAIDNCGLRYLLALENYLSVSMSLPKDIAPDGVASSDIIWAFHSDAETELLSHIPCVQNNLNWSDLRSAGVGWWIRSTVTLRKLIEQVCGLWSYCNNLYVLLF